MYNKYKEVKKSTKAVAFNLHESSLNIFAFYNYFPGFDDASNTRTLIMIIQAKNI